VGPFGCLISTRRGRADGLVGDNGSGKTTLVKLLLRFYGSTEGRISANGVDLREVDLDSYYARIGVIFQQGTHMGLMQRNGRYAALFRMQARWYG
jgi:ABC-type multidrug transport system fused ATPase/permease subunit